MRRTFILIATLLLLTLSGPIASAQVKPGTPRFGSFGGGPDVINLANLNTHIDIPVVHKPGRGTNFDYDLTYDSSVWYPVTSGPTTSWQNVANWGWASKSAFNSGSSGYLIYFVSSDTCYDALGFPVGTKVSYTGPDYYDSWGTLHRFSGVFDVIYGPCVDVPQNYYPARALDGSGLKADFYNGPIITPGGEILNPPANPNGGSYNTTITDRNGNQMTANTGGVFTDTLGQTALTISGANPVNFTYTAPSGVAASVRMNYAQYTVRTWFQVPEIADYGATSVSLVSSIVLPDNSQYSFTYEPTPPGAGCTPLAGTTACVTARIASVTLPTGGQIWYSYSGGYGGIFSDGSTATLTRTTPDSTPGSWTYAQVKGTYAASTTTVTDPQNNQTVIQFQGIYETQRQTYQGSTSGTLLQAINTCYNGAASPCTGTDIISPISRRTQIIQLGSNGPQCKHDYFYNAYSLQTRADDYDYGPSIGPLIRKVLTTYAPLGNNIVDMPDTVTVQNGSLATVAQTSYFYDQTAPAATSATPQHVAITGSRGNVTTIKQYTSGSTFLTKTLTYFDTGNVQTATDVNGAITTYVYADAASTCGNSFPTSVNEPLNLSRSMTWNCVGGVQLTSTDENSKTTTTAYTDAGFWRPASVADPANNVTSFSYGINPTGVASSLTFNANQSIANTGNGFDGLGRLVQISHLQGPAAGTWDQVVQSYDSKGRLWKTSMPCITTGPWTCPVTDKTITYDGLDRVTQETDGGGGTTTYSYNQNDVLVTAGPAPAGENNKRRQLEYDSLGRLTSVCEITAGTTSYPAGTCDQKTPQTGYWTKYSYDALGNLTAVTQNAQAPAAQQQARAYNYDWLSRLTSETTPESGTKTYVYDLDPACGTYYGDLVKTVNGAGVATCSRFDALHRLAYISNTDSNGCKFFSYDTVGLGYTQANIKGRLANAWIGNCTTGAATRALVGFNYSARGEVINLYQWTPRGGGGWYDAVASYWPNGAVKTLQLFKCFPDNCSSTSGDVPVTPLITYNVDGEGRSNSVLANSGQNPVTSTSYNVSSQPTDVTFGSLDKDVFGYDPSTGRMVQYQFKIGATPQSVIGSLTWNANSTLQQLAINDPFNAANTQICIYAYDDVIRLNSANCGAPASQTFTYDPFGNINKAGSPYSFNAAYSPSTNRMASIGTFTPTYDGNGNVTNDGLHTYSWDPNYNVPLSIDSVGLTYGALGRMVEQNRSGVYTQIVYSPTGQKLALMNAQTLQKAFIPLPGGATAVYTSSGLDHYRHPDWLGSARLTSSPTRTVLSSVAYAPFGEPYAQFGPADLSFTGQNQDTSGGAYDFLAREYGIQGRWPSPDPIGLAAADLSDPQSLNLYAYARNNPLLYTDPLGLDYSVCMTGFGCTTVPDWGALVGLVTGSGAIINGTQLSGLIMVYEQMSYHYIGDYSYFPGSTPSGPSDPPSPPTNGPASGGSTGSSKSSATPKAQPKLCNPLALKWASIEWTIKVGPEFEFANITFGAAIFRNLTAKQGGAAITANFADVLGISLQRLNPVGAPINANGGPFELHGQFLGVETKIPKGEVLTNSTSGTIGFHRYGLMLGVGFEAAINPETFHRLAQEQGCIE